MRIMAIWNTNDADAVKIIRDRKGLAKSKFQGRKPDKLIVPADDIDKFRMAELKKAVSRNGLIIGLGMTEPIYDGRVK